MKIDIKSRLKNYGFWISIIALVPMVLNTLGLNILPKDYSSIANEILGLLVLLGIVNNPTTDSKGFSDDK